MLGPRRDHRHPAGDYASRYNTAGYDTAGYDTPGYNAAGDHSAGYHPASYNAPRDNSASDDPTCGQLGHVMRHADTNSWRHGERIDQR